LVSYQRPARDLTGLDDPPCQGQYLFHFPVSFPDLAANDPS
jgi:hypothetical protein